MRLLMHSETGELQRVASIEGYGDDWIDRGEIPEDVPPNIAVWDEAAESVVPDLSGPVAAALAWVSEEFARQVALGCDSPKGWVECDEKAQGRIERLIKLWEQLPIPGTPSPETILFTMFDTTIKEPHSYDELVTLGITIGLNFLAKFSVKQGLETAINAAAATGSLAAIQAIITEGWPS